MTCILYAYDYIEYQTAQSGLKCMSVKNMNILSDHYQTLHFLLIHNSLNTDFILAWLILSCEGEIGSRQHK